RLLIYKENSTNCYFSIYLFGWETLVNNLSKRERKIVNAYRVSGFWGDLKLRYYKMRHKL
ncbi:hypothetical protein PL499_24940, partial [Bacteroides xylanisolvens]|nr:hypothetical protein [Bacteroides xylanisolvens]